MGFFDELEKLRSRPEGERKKILAAGVIIIMALVTALWAGNLNFGHEENARGGLSGEISAQAGLPAEAGPAPWEVLKKTFQGSFEDLKNNLKLNQQ